MEEFEDSQLRDLQEVEGIDLRDVHGERVAIGRDFLMRTFLVSWSIILILIPLMTLPKSLATKMVTRCLNIGFLKKQNLLNLI